MWIFSASIGTTNPKPWFCTVIRECTWKPNIDIADLHFWCFECLPSWHVGGPWWMNVLRIFARKVAFGCFPPPKWLPRTGKYNYSWIGSSPLHARKTYTSKQTCSLLEVFLGFDVNKSAKFSQNVTTNLWSNLGFLKVCRNAYFYSFLRDNERRGKRGFWQDLFLGGGGWVLFFFGGGFGLRFGRFRLRWGDPKGHLASPNPSFFWFVLFDWVLEGSGWGGAKRPFLAVLEIWGLICCQNPFQDSILFFLSLHQPFSKTMPLFLSQFFFLLPFLYCYCFFQQSFLKHPHFQTRVAWIVVFYLVLFCVLLVVVSKEPLFGPS